MYSLLLLVRYGKIAAIAFFFHKLLNFFSTMKQTIDSYNRSAEQYEARFMDYSTYREKIEYFQAKYIADSCSILDLGCGPGNNARILQHSNSEYKITGIDLSPRMIELAQDNAPGCIFIVGDIRSFLSEMCYDVILASFCIVHLMEADTRKLVEKISASLHAGGYLYLSFMEGNTAGYETTSYSDQEIFFHYYPREIISRILEKNHLTVVEVMVEDYREESGDITKDIFIIARKEC